MSQGPLLVAFSDPHVGRVWGAHTVPARREALTARYLDPIKELLTSYSCPRVCGGDWFDKAHNSEALIQASNTLIKGVDLVVAGNHDHVNRESALTSLQLLRGLDHEESIAMADDHLNEATATFTELSGIGVYTVPHHATQALFEQACYDAAEGAKGGGQKHNVLFLHCNLGSIGGGKSDSNLYLTPALQKALEAVFDFILLGHEHLPRRIGKTIVMGSTQPCNFGELGPRFFYEFHKEGEELTIKQVPIKTQMKHAVLDCSKEVNPPALPAEIYHLTGIAPMSQAKAVQKLVAELYEAGALAVKMDVKFESGVTLDGEAVSGTMRNLVDVVRAEIADNPKWTGLLDEALKEINEEKV